MPSPAPPTRTVVSVWQVARYQDVVSVHSQGLQAEVQMSEYSHLMDLTKAILSIPPFVS